MQRRYIHFQGDIYVVVGIGQHRPGGSTKSELCFTVIELNSSHQLMNDNVPCLRIPVSEAIEITNEKMLETLRILYEK